MWNHSSCIKKWPVGIKLLGGACCCSLCVLKKKRERGERESALDWRNSSLDKCLNPVNEGGAVCNVDSRVGLTMESWVSLDNFATFRLSKSKGMYGCVCLSVLCLCLSGEEAQVNPSINFAFFEPWYISETGPISATCPVICDSFRKLKPTPREGRKSWKPEMQVGSTAHSGQPTERVLRKPAFCGVKTERLPRPLCLLLV